MSTTTVPAVILGTGMTRFGRHEGTDVVSLAAEAGKAAMRDAGVVSDDVDTLVLGNFAGQSLTHQGVLASLVARALGLGPVPATTVEGACASGSIALRQGIMSCGAGAASFALCIGAEHLTAASTTEVTGVLAEASHQSTDGAAGLTFAGFYGLVASAHATRYGTTRDQLSAVPLKSRRHAESNDLAMFRTPLDATTIAEAKPVADPLRLFDCCPVADGAAAAVVAGPGVATRAPGTIRVLACEHASGAVAIRNISDLATCSTTIAAATRAYRAAGISASDIDVAELHDCFSIAEIVDSEDLGFFAPGDAAPAIADGVTSCDTPGLVVNPSGGLLARGHPVGATGIAQVHELVRQLRGSAARQVPDPAIALAHNLGGAGAAATVTILEAS